MDKHTKLLEVFPRILPRIAEEGGDREEIPQADLIRRLIEATETDLNTATAVTGCLRRLLQGLSILDERMLASDVWGFVSFPASLMARSILTGMGSAEFRWLEPGFWDASDYRIDRQRALIKRSEELRATLPVKLIPIRRVWVSWAWMAMDGKFLMVRREDPGLRREGSRGQFVFPGGRVAAEDLRGEAFQTTANRLDFFDSNVEIDLDHSRHAFSVALIRELLEELEIPHADIEAATPVDDPIYYETVEGAKSAYSATAYCIQPFGISLKDSGKTRLLRSLAAYPERYAWFSAEELKAGVNAGGDEAFVDAIRDQDAPLDPERLVVSIGDALPSKDVVEIPGNTSESFVIGVTGRERRRHMDLGSQDIELLNWLAAVRKGEAIESLSPNVSVVNDVGWVLVDDDSVFTSLKSLASRLEANNMPFLDFHDRAVRLNVAMAYFSSSMFSMEILDERRGKSYLLKLRRGCLQSALGVVRAQEASVSLPEILGNAIYSLNEGDPKPALDNMDSVKRMQRDIRDFLDKLGARLLIRQVDGVPELAVGVGSSR